MCARNTLLYLNTFISSIQRRTAGSQESRLLTLLRTRKNTSSLFLHGWWQPRSIFLASHSPRTLNGTQPSYTASPFIHGVGYTTLGAMSMYGRAPQLPSAIVSTEVRNNVSLAGVWNQEWIREDERPWRRTLRSANNATELTTSELFAQQSICNGSNCRYSRKYSFDQIISNENGMRKSLNVISKNKDKRICGVNLN